MRMWLAAAVAVPLAVSFPANAQVNRLEPHSAEKAAAAPNYVLPTIPQFRSQSALQDGMIAREDVAPNAHLGVGLAPMLGRNIHSVRIQQEPVPTRNPGVTFVFKFPR